MKFRTVSHINEFKKNIEYKLVILSKHLEVLVVDIMSLDSSEFLSYFFDICWAQVLFFN